MAVAAAVAMTETVPLAFIVSVLPEMVMIEGIPLLKVIKLPEVLFAESVKVPFLMKFTGVVGVKLTVWAALATVSVFETFAAAW